MGMIYFFYGLLGKPTRAKLTFEPFHDYRLTSGEGFREANLMFDRGVDLPRSCKTSTLRQLQAVMNSDEIATIRRALTDSEPQHWGASRGSVQQVYLEWNGDSASDVIPPTDARDSAQKIVDERFLPYIRERYSCPECKLCASLVRRFTSGNAVPPHFDDSRFLIMVVSLSQSSRDFDGGLYVRAQGREDLWLDEKLGDAFLFQFDVEHGVYVEQGLRHSWVLSFQQNCSGSEDASYAKLHKHRAEVMKDPIAEFHMGLFHTEGRGGVRQDIVAGVEWFRRSAGHGYARAQLMMGDVFAQGLGVAANSAAARFWYSKVLQKKAYDDKASLASTISARVWEFVRDSLGLESPRMSDVNVAKLRERADLEVFWGPERSVLAKKQPKLFIFSVFLFTCGVFVRLSAFRLNKL
eukprot:TRINITY_DN47717_c0_g1_i1.p1 TRINITY_DN47717_c0_g1~~TRINITY_DN47717_c0_g1_i1.p1  ORF type:complete len:438 (+),score=50.52 TRINITY_DN47717_c0_g1_i1:89-1315(+)